MLDKRSLIVLHEGKRLKPYRCTAGKLTIGVGRNLDDVGISEEEAAFLFESDLRRVEESLSRCFPWSADLDEVRRAVLADMCFNLGVVGLAKFKNFLSRMEAGDFKAASLEMLDSRWAVQVGARARRLSTMVESGEWPST